MAATIPAIPAPAITTSADWRSVSMTEYIPRVARIGGEVMKPRSLAMRPIASFIAGLVLTLSAQAQGVLDTKKGQGGSDVQGAAGTQGARAPPPISKSATSRWARWPSSSRRTT